MIIRITKWSLCLIFSINSFLSFGHSPSHSSTIIAQQEDKSWVLQVNASLSAFQMIFENDFGPNSYQSPEEFENMVLKHIKENISIIADNTQQIQLGIGGLQLGHEIKVAFKLIDVPKLFNQLRITNTCFQNIQNSRSTFILLKKGYANNNKFSINFGNNFTVNLISEDNKFIEDVPSNPWKVYILVFLVAIITIATYLIILKFR